jgi:hypothetical protein
LSIGADRGDDGIWIYGLAGSFVIINNGQIASGVSSVSRDIDFVIKNSSSILDRGYSGCSLFHHRHAT